MKIRLQRFMADCGIASRRECEEYIQGGRVQVNGQVQTQMPVMIDPDKDIITVDDETLAAGKPLQEQEKAYYLLNKPKGVLVTNYDPADRKLVGELMLGIAQRVFPVGRLDMDARGALIMTNDGELANRLTHPRHGVEKTYIVEVDGRLSPGEVEKIKRGMWLGPEHSGQPGGMRTERFGVKIIGRERGRTILEMKSSEGKNREIRRVMARLGHPVRDLNRVAIAGKVTIRNLDVGKFRPLAPHEVQWLYKASSKEFHEQQKSATQQWYEQKEMEKERKRLVREAAQPPARRAKPANYIGGAKRRPPGKPRFEKSVREFAPPAKMAKSGKTAHPLGESAIRDDEF